MVVQEGKATVTVTLEYSDIVPQLCTQQATLHIMGKAVGVRRSAKAHTHHTEASLFDNDHRASLGSHIFMLAAWAMDLDKA